MLKLKLPLILASKSPRRRELLSKTGLDFDIFSMDVDESFSDEMPVEQVAEYLARKKGQAYETKFPQHLIIAADTTVVTADEVLNKPADKGEAFQMIDKLRGKQHAVITGVCIVSPGKQHSFSETTQVSFGDLSDEEINYYIQQYKPFDKAGAYGIQEWIGLIGIESINGSYYNVVGLPVKKIYDYLKSFSV